MIPILALHIPDGFLSVPVSLFGWILAITLIGLALRYTRDQFGERQIPLVGVLAAFIFAAQMINFPVAGGTSGHLIGGMLAAILLGPWGAVLIMTSVVSVQALLFQDGGILALGFNIFNMGIVAPFVGYTVYSWLKNLPQGQWIGAAVGAWIGVQVAALCTALQLAASDTTALDVALPAMLGVHALIGIGEALITVATLAYIQQTRPDLLPGFQESSTRNQRTGWVTALLVVAIGIALISPLASASPDGLERVATDKGFIDTAEAAPYEILPDYTIPFIENETLTTITAGLVGVLLLAGMAFGVNRAVKNS